MDSCSNVSLPSNYNSSSTSITELLGALCDSSLSGVSWKRRALGGISRDAVRRSLRKQAYGALLSKLFLEGPQKRPSSSVSNVTSTTPPRNKVLMISFDLRVAGCQDEAERLEDHLDRLADGPASGLGELNSVLELLVQLAGSAPPPPTSFSRDYMRRERPVLRRPPLGGWQSEELQRLEARAWALVCGEEWGSLGAMCGTLGLMEALPGTGLLALGRKAEVEEKFERETRMSLFGALLHTRTSDLDIRLDLPPVPSNADVTGLAIRVPPYLDQSEDEGFQSASNLTPDSQSEPSPSPELDVWEAIRTFEPARRRCWEGIGCPPGKTEAPYLTEGGREAFDHLYRLWEGEMRGVSSATPSPLLPLPLDSQSQLVSDLLNVLIGVASTTFPLNQVCVQFDVRPGVCVSGASPESVSRLLGDLAQYGTHYLRLSRFSLQSAHKRGLVFQAFTGGLRKYLHYYRACVLSTPSTLSLLTFGFLFRKVGRQLRYLSELCCVDGACGVGQATFPVGVKLLSCLYNEAQSNCSNENYLVLLSLLKSSCEPYTRFVSDWVYSGVFRDVYGEFMIQVNEDYLGCRDKNFWVQGYTLISREAEACVPVFLRHMASDVYVCGKTINLLKICCPQHYICGSELPVPRISVTFSLQEVEEIERDCAVYRGRVERIAKHSAISREEQALRTEQARQDLINQVRDSAAKTLESIRGRQVSQRLVEEAKKRERFEELRQHLEQEVEWQKKKQEDDYSFARELRDREKRLQALKEQLEERARKELIAQYSHLSEEATRRERRALWRVQRMRLDENRAQFLLQDKLHTEALLERYPLGQTGPPPESLMPASSAQQESEPALGSVDPEGSGLPLGTPRPPLQPPSATEAPALISQDTQLPQLLPQLQPSPQDSQQVEQALQEIGSDLPKGPPQPQSQPQSDVDYDFSAPFSPLGGMLEPDQPPDGAPDQPQNRALWGAMIQPDIPLSHPSDSHIPIGENMSDVLERLHRPSPHGQATQSSFPLGQYTPDVPISAPHEPGLHGHPSQASVQPPDTLHGPNVHGHSSDSHIKVGENVSDVTVALHTPNVHGHSSDSHVKVGEFVFDVETQRHGHASDTTLLHGQPSQASVQLADGSETKMIESCVSCFLPAAEQELAAVTGTGGSVENASQGPGNEAGEEREQSQLENQTAGPLISPETRHGGGDLPCQSPPSLSIPITTVPAHASDTCVPVRENASVADYLHTRSVNASHDHVKEGQGVAEVIDSQPSLNAHGHPSDAHLKVGEFVSEATAHRPAPSVHGQISDAHIEIGEYVSDATVAFHAPNVHGHSSDGHIRVGENVSDATVAFHTPSVHGHSSDGHIKVGENVSDATVTFHAPNVHGHSSDGHIKVGENVSDATVAFHAPNVHGHSSDSHIKAGENISDVSPQLPTPSIHGHSSDSHVKAGEFVFDVETERPRWNEHGHASDSTLQAGCVMLGSDVAMSSLPGSAFGHSSDSTLGAGCVMSGSVPLPSPLPGSEYGHSSDSTLGAGCVMSGSVPLPAPLPGSEYGHSSDSTLGAGCVMSGSVPLPSPLPGSEYGHSSDSTLGAGCVMSGSVPLPAPLPGSQYGHSSDSALGSGCVVKDTQGPKAWASSEQQQLDEGISSWAASFGRPHGAAAEQDYLLSLAAQYEVEPYEDCSNLMMLSPECQLLQQVTRGPWGLPMDPSLRRATDTTPVQLSEMVSLPVLMKHSVTTPLITHVSLVNKAVVDYFFVELGVERHFEALRHFLLMEDGEFAQSLSDLLFEKLASGQTPGELLTPLVLNSILSKALQYSLHGDNALAPNFTFALRFLPETFHPHAPDSLNCLELRYKVDWPLNIIVTDSCMNKYNRLFSFLLQLKHMVWSLRDVWFHLKRTALVKGAGRSVQFRQLQLYRHEMQHFVKVIQGYIANQILQVSWSEFKTKMATVNDLDAIHRTHADYLNRAIFRGLLTEKAAPVMNIIHSIFSLILKFRAQLIAQPWSSHQGEAVHPSFIAMQQSYNTFKYYSQFLFKVVTKLVNRGYQPHLEDFLLRINFNNYYKDS